MFIGIDLGTTSIKVSCFNSFGKLICVKRKQNEVIIPQKDWAELNPEKLWNDVQELIFAITRQLNEKILAISFSSQGEGVVPLDAAFNPVGNIILSYDKRAKFETDEIHKRISAEELYDITGQIISSVHTAPKILWLQKHLQWCSSPPVFFVCVSDYIISRFGLPPSTDYSLAARTMMFDITKKDWSEKILQIIGISKKQLPLIFKAGSLLESPNKTLCKQLGLSESVCIIQGAHDQACSKFGCAAFNDHEAAYSLGTTETLICETNSFLPSLQNIGLPCYPHVVEKKFITLPGNFTGGNIIQWYGSQFVKHTVGKITKTYYDSIFADMSDKPTNLMVLPHFTTTGSPYNDDSSTGTIIGLSIHTTRSEFIRALIEGVTYEILLNLRLLGKTGIKITKLIAMGGGTQQHKVMQLKSDILGLPIEVCNIREVACRGAAMLAACGFDKGLYLDFFNKIADEKRLSFIPNLEYTQIYGTRFATYKKMYKAVTSLIL